MAEISEFLEKVKSSFDAGQINDAVEILAEAAKNLSKTSNLSSSEIFLWEKFGVHLLLMGEIEQLVDVLAKMTKMHPWNAEVHSHLLFGLHHLPGIDQQTIFDEHKRWAQIHAPVDKMESFYGNSPDPDRRLRIGYISPDFCMHPVAFFIGSLIYGHNRQKVEVYGYGNTAKLDATTEYLKGKFDFYRNIYGLDTPSLIELIRDDKIDILVELAGHTNNNSLTALAYKPAPIQVSYLGYPGTTAMPQIDYRLTDECVNPPQSQKYYTEELVYLPQPFTCYNTADSQTQLTALPAEHNGFITFGSFQNNCKINSEILSLWAKILKAVANSRLLLRFAKGDTQNIREYYLKRFERLGITRNRIEIGGWLTYLEHLRQYENVDIALDTFPFNGHTTICDALWMGVPTISLSGESFASRLGLDMLKSVGLEFFAAKTPDEYAAKAVSLAQNIQSLAKIRASMRQRMLAGTLCNPKAFASAVEDMYRKMWHKWCKNQKETGKTKDSQQHNTRKITVTAGIIDQPAAKRGIIYMIWGNDEKHEQTLQRSIASVKEYHPELPIHIERLKAGGKINKTRLCNISPFEETLFLDNDTVVMGRLDFGFEKARQFGLACAINECPWARRYSDKRLSGDIVEYNSGVLFFTRKAKPLFDAWAKLFPTVNASIFHIQDDKLCLMPIADQGSFAMAFEQTEFLPFVLPFNWNFRAQFYRSCYGPIKIWHSYYDIPENLLNWNKKQSAENAILQFLQVGIHPKNVPDGNVVESNK